MVLGGGSGTRLDQTVTHMATTGQFPSLRSDVGPVFSAASRPARRIVGGYSTREGRRGPTTFRPLRRSLADLTQFRGPVPGLLVEFGQTAACWWHRGGRKERVWPPWAAGARGRGWGHRRVTRWLRAPPSGKRAKKTARAAKGKQSGRTTGRIQAVLNRGPLLRARGGGFDRPVTMLGESCRITSGELRSGWAGRTAANPGDHRVRNTAAGTWRWHDACSRHVAGKKIGLRPRSRPVRGLI